MNGVQALNRSLPDWFQHATSGQLKLPRFQRFGAWGHNEAAICLNRKRRQNGSKQCRSKAAPGISPMMNRQRGNILAGANVAVYFQTILLAGEGQLSSTDSFRALDCALVILKNPGCGLPRPLLTITEISAGSARQITGPGQSPSIRTKMIATSALPIRFLKIRKWLSAGDGGSVFLQLFSTHSTPILLPLVTTY